MTAAALLEFGGFRCHVLLAGEFVGSIIGGRPTFRGLELEPSGRYAWQGRPILDVFRVDTRNRSVVRVRSLAPGVWIQEPGLTVRVAGTGAWRGFGVGGKWTPTTKGVDRWLALSGPGAYFSTVHWTRVRALGPNRRNPGYTVGVEYAEAPAVRWRFRSDGGFTALLEAPAGRVPWAGCQVFGQAWKLAGVYDEPDEHLRRWELAKHGREGWLHFLGWTGGPGAVVNEAGRTPAPGSNPGPAAGFDRLWNPRGWRELEPGRPLEQTLTAEWRAGPPR